MKQLNQTKKPVGCMTCPREVDFKKFRNKAEAEMIRYRNLLEGLK